MAQSGGTSTFFVNVTDTTGNVVVLPDSAYVDNSSTIVQNNANTYSDNIVSQTLKDLLPTFPTPSPPTTGQGAWKIWNAKLKNGAGDYLIFRDQIYVDDAMNNAAATAISQANAFTLIKVSDATTNINNRTDAAIANSATNTQALITQASQTLNANISNAVSQAKAYTDQQIEDLGTSTFSFEQFLTYIDRMDAS